MIKNKIILSALIIALTLSLGITFHFQKQPTRRHYKPRSEKISLIENFNINKIVSEKNHSIEIGFLRKDIEIHCPVLSGSIIFVSDCRGTHVWAKSSTTRFSSDHNSYLALFFSIKKQQSNTPKISFKNLPHQLFLNKAEIPLFLKIYASANYNIFDFSKFISRKLIPDLPPPKTI